MNNGMEATVIAVREYNDIDVQFSDGVIAKGKRINAFLNGEIAHPDFATPVKESSLKNLDAGHKKDDRTGETKTMSNGQECTIIRYKNKKDIDVQFEDGTFVENKQYVHFRLGNIKNPNKVCRNLFSFNELVCEHYFGQLGFKKADKGTVLYNRELDLYNDNLNGHKVAIEYDGDARSHTPERDKAKYDMCKEKNIHLIRIREPKMPELDFGTNFKIESANHYSISLTETIQEVVSYINEAFKTDYKIEIDRKKDRAKIEKRLKKLSA